MQEYGNKEGREGEFMNKPVLFVLFSILNHSKDNDSDDDEDSVVDGNEDSDITDGLGKAVDWSKVKRNIRECDKVEGAITKSNKPLVLKSFLKEDEWCLASMCLCLVPTGSVNIASGTILKDKYVEVMKACVDDMSKKPIVPVE
eukprot:824447-Ditylum_brightwellii.AAC.1